MPSTYLAVGGFLAAAGLILARLAEVTATYDAGRFHNRRRTVAARMLCWSALAIVLSQRVDIHLT